MDKVYITVYPNKDVLDLLANRSIVNLPKNWGKRRKDKKQKKVSKHLA